MVSYQQAIHAIGKASNGRGIYEGPGISIKLSALHPRYSRAQYDRVMEELYPRLKSLTCWRASMTSASILTPKRPTVWRSPSTCWKNCASSRNWPAGTGLAS
ncbi:proline dehydrogenase family protein [Klebsiella pneumoniae]|uniref:Proline dehydrogenase family protein n=1 Tax=Klebsiella pneumoniae TaxID=573 RepID=A0A923EMS1_KLEPN|nr:proline dehydrogenase family protein [Klebsiella pneumoniae]